MMQEFPVESELDWLSKIIGEATKKAGPKTPSITQVLKVYDEFIDAKSIVSGSQLAQNIYKKILHAARKAKPNEIWTEKIFDTSKNKSKIPNIFEHNLATDQTSFSFCRDSVKEHRTNQSFSHGEKMNTSFTDIMPPINHQRASHKPRSSSRIEENKNRTENARDTTQRKNRWDSNLEGIYRNRHLSGQRENSYKSNNESRDYYSVKYRDQSPPIRDQSFTKTTEENIENKENRDSNREFNNTEQSDLSQVYNIFKYTMQKKDSVRPQSVSRLSVNSQLPRGSSNSTVKRTETNEDFLRKEDNMFKRTQAKPNKRLLRDCFGALKIYYLRKKRISQKVLTLRMRFRNKAIKKGLRKWRNYLKDARAGNIAEEEHNELYLQKLLLKHFNTWKASHEAIVKFTKRTENFLTMCKNHSLSKLFQAWKKYHYTRKRDKINKIAARAFRERRATKKFFNSWRLYAGEKEYYNKISLELCRKYKNKLRLRAFMSMKMFKKVVEENRQSKYELLSRGELLFKQKSFQRFRECYKEERLIREINTKSKRLALHLGFKTFKKKFVDFVNRKRELHIMISKAHAYRVISLLKLSWDSWHFYMNEQNVKAVCSQQYHMQTLCQKTLYALKKWQVASLVPNFASQGTVVWVLYNFLCCFAELEPERLPTAREINEQIPAILEVNLRDQEKKMIVFHFNLPLYFAVSKNRKYKQLNMEANRTLNKYIQKKIFYSWKKASTQSLVFKKKIYLKTMRKYFKTIENYSTKKIIQKHKLDTVLSQKNKTKISSIFGAWSRFANKRKIIHNIYNEEINRRKSDIIASLFSIWRSKTGDIVFEKRMEAKADDFYNSYALRKGFISLFRYLIFSKKARGIIEEVSERKQDRLLQKAFRGFIIGTINIQRKNQKRIKAQIYYNQNFLRKCLYFWSKYQSYKQRLSEINAVYKIRNKKILLTKIMRSWKRHARDLRIKNNLKVNLLQHYNNKITNKAFSTLYAYKTRRIAQGQWDQRVSQQISMLPLQRFFKKWFKASIYNLLLPRFVKTVETLQMRQLFKNIQLKAYKEEMLNKALYENSLYHVRRTNFYALKRLWKKNRNLRQLSFSYQSQNAMKTLFSSYQLWRKKFLFEKNMIYMYAKALIEVKNTILIKYFSILKKKWSLKNKVQTKTKERKLNQKQAVLNAWALLIKKKNLLHVLEQKYKKDQHLQIKRIYLYKIGHVFAKRNRDQQIANIITKARTHKFLSLWVENFNAKHDWRKISLGPYNMNTKVSTPRRAVFNYNLYQKPYRQFYYQLKNIYVTSMQKKFFNAWHYFSAKSAFFKKKVEELQDNATVMKNHYQVWRNLFNKKQNYRDKIEGLFTIMKRYSNQIFFDEVVRDVNEQIEEEIADERSLFTYVKNIRAKAFYGWEIISKEYAVKRRNNDIATSNYAGNLMRKALLTLSEYTIYRSEKKRGQRQALIIYAYQLMRSHFYYWKKYNIQKTTLATRALDFKRNRMNHQAPIFFQQLKLNFYLDSFKKIALPKVIRFYGRMLKIKAFLGFKVNSTRRLLKDEQQMKADSQYMRFLLWKGLRGWFIFILRKKQKEEDTGVLMETIEKMRNNTLLENSLAMWKLYTEESQDFILNAQTLIVENSLRRVLTYWKNYKETKKHEKVVLENFDNYRAMKNKVNYFQKWREMFQLKNKMNQFSEYLTKIYVRFCFNEIKLASHHNQLIGGHNLNWESNLKARYMMKWVEYSVKFKQDANKYNTIRLMHEEKNKKSMFYAWQKLHWVNIMKENKLRQLQKKVFFALRQHLERSRRNKEICQIMLHRFVKKIFDSLVQNQENKQQAKRMLLGFIERKEERLLENAGVYLQKWRKNAQEITFDMKTTTLAAKYASKSVMKKVWTQLKQHYYQRLLAKAFTDRVTYFCENYEPKLNKIWGFHNLKRFGTSLNNVEKGLNKLSISLKKMTFVFPMLEQHMIEENKNLQILSEAKSRNRIRYLNKMFKYLQLNAIQNQQARINTEKANQFLFEKYYVNFQKQILAAWKLSVDEQKASFQNNVKELQEKLIKSRQKSFFVVLKGKTDQNKKTREIMNDRKFKEFLATRAQRTCKISFLGLKELIKEKKARRYRNHEIIHRMQLFRMKTLLAAHFNEWKDVYIEEKANATRSKLYSIFSSWKLYAKEKVLLKKYLKESNIDEEYAYTPSVNRQRDNDNLRMTISSMNYTNYSGGLSSRISHPLNDNVFNSPDHFDKDFQY